MKDDPKKDIEEFKENNNLKNRMKKFHQLYEETIQFKKMQYLKNFCKVMSEFIDTFTTYDLNNEPVFEKYYLYLKGLFKSYNTYFSKFENDELHLLLFRAKFHYLHFLFQVLKNQLKYLFA